MKKIILKISGLILSCFLLFFLSLAIQPSVIAESDYLKLIAPNNGWFSTRVIPVRGQTNVKEKTVRIVYNGIPFLLPVANGSFERSFVASPGINNIYAESITGSGKVLKDQISFYSKAPSKAMKIFLTWDTDGTDVDLWIIEPTGEKCYYGYKNTKIGGTLDVDVTNGYGPEVYTLASGVKGNYTIQVHSYADYRIPQTEAKIYVVLHEGTPNEVIKEYETMLTQAGSMVTVDTINF